MKAPPSQYWSLHCDCTNPIAFKLIDEIDPKPLMEAIIGYGSKPFDTNHRNLIPEHRYTQTMMLSDDDCPVLNYTKSLARRYDETVVRAQVTRLEPNQMVYPHFDRGDFFLLHDRYHIVVSSDGSRMSCGDQVQDMKVGEVWWFNNKLIHSAENLGDTWRTHVIFDVTTKTIR